ncbi:hypothetical protein BpHYR1_019847 [Brachionus plicatilis]|uniref:Uncharacterized protein n=1 Tax=Brachionus plicatilis TaxID=10195 RepID=A0A3M7QPH4_BRAPC|nr:hypothetical protein BpHYR1_019847 [Brachionus plicatilis]
MGRSNLDHCYRKKKEQIKQSRDSRENKKNTEKTPFSGVKNAGEERPREGCFNNIWIIKYIMSLLYSSNYFEMNQQYHIIPDDVNENNWRILYDCPRNSKY